MRYLITGGRGFIGRHLESALRRSDPAAEVICTGREVDLTVREAAMQLFRDSGELDYILHLAHIAGDANWSQAHAVSQFLANSYMATHVIDATQTQLNLQVTAVFALAAVQLARRAYSEAVEAAREAHRRLIEEPVEEWDEAIRLCFIESLLATELETDADTVLKHAFDALRLRVGAIQDNEYRHSLVTRNAEVRRLLELAGSRLSLYL